MLIIIFLVTFAVDNKRNIIVHADTQISYDVRKLFDIDGTHILSSRTYENVF